LAGERSEAWQEVFFYWSPQTVKKIIKKREKKLKTKSDKSQLAGERSEAWQEVFLYWSPQTVKKITKKECKNYKQSQIKKLKIKKGILRDIKKKKRIETCIYS